MESNGRQGAESYSNSSNGENDHNNMPGTRTDQADPNARSNSQVLDLFRDLYSFESMLSPATVNEVRSCSKRVHRTPPGTPNYHLNLAGSSDNLQVVIPGLCDEDEISHASTPPLDAPLTERDSRSSDPRNASGRSEIAQLIINDEQCATMTPYSTPVNSFDSGAFENWNQDSSATSIATALKWPNLINGAENVVSEAELKKRSLDSGSSILYPIVNPKFLNDNVMTVTTHRTNDQQFQMPEQSSIIWSTNGTSSRPGDSFNPSIFPNRNQQQVDPGTKSWTMNGADTQSWTTNLAQVDTNIKTWTTNPAQVDANTRIWSTNPAQVDTNTKIWTTNPAQVNTNTKIVTTIPAQVDTNTMSWTNNPVTTRVGVLDGKPRTSLSVRGSSSWIASSCALESTNATGQYKNGGQTVEQQGSSNSAQQIGLSGNNLHDVESKRRVCLDHPSYRTWFYCGKDRLPVCCVCIMEGVGNHFHTGGFLPVPLPNCGDDGEARLKNVILLEKTFLQMYRRLPTYMAVRNPFVMSKNNHLVFDESKLSQLPSLALIIKHFNELLILINVYENFHVDFENSMRRCHDDFMTFVNQNKNDIECRHIPLTGDYPVHLPNCYVEGQGTFESVAGCRTSFFVVARDADGAPCEIGKFPLDVNVKRVADDERQVAISTRHYKDGVLQILTQFDKVGTYSFSIRINSIEVKEPTILLEVKAKADTLLGMRATSHLNIPTLYNRILRACVNNVDETFFSEKDQNCFEVWSADFTKCVPSTKLGTAVKNLLKPTGIAIDQNNDLIICDSGNNRICVFGSGQYIRQSPASTNLYNPTSVIVNASNEYIVLHSESKICVMSADFQQLNHIDLIKTKPGITAWGICLGYLDEVFVTDCNSGDILVVDTSSKVSKIAFTCSGDGRTMSRKSMRGIAMNKQGYFIVADYANSCIEAYSQTGHFMEKFPFREKPLDVAVFKNSRYDLIVTRERAPPILFGAPSRLYVK